VGPFDQVLHPGQAWGKFVAVTRGTSASVNVSAAPWRHYLSVGTPANAHARTSALLSLASQAVGAAPPPLLLHAAGRNLQQPSSEAGPTRCWVRYRGQYLQCSATLFDDMLPAQV
jgi:hypothetical protein